MTVESGESSPPLLVHGALSDRAINFLVTLKEISPNRVMAEDLVVPLDAKSVKGIGPIIFGIKNEIMGVGLNPDRVIHSMPGKDGPSWAIGPDTDLALERGGIVEGN